MTVSSSSRLSARQLRVVALSSSGGFVDGFDLIMLGSAIILIRPDFGLQPLQVGVLTAAAYAGAFVAAVVAGFLTDLIGRRATFIASLAIMAVASIASAISPTFLVLVLARFLVGVGIGMDLPTSGAMTAEFVPARVRGAALATWQLCWTVGALLCPVVAVAMLPLGDGAWRWMLGACALPALIILIARHSIPETPRWLALKGRTREADEVNQWAGISAETDAELDTERVDEPATSQWQQSLAVFSGPFRRSVAVLSALSICGSVASLFLGTYSAFLASSLGATSDRSAILFGMLIWSAYLVGNVVNIAITDRVGRKPLLIAGGVVTTLALVAAAKVGLSEESIGLVFAIFGIGGFSYWCGVNQAIWQYTAELFPTSVRGTARGFTTGWTRLAAVLSGIFTPVLVASIGFSGAMLVFAVFAFGIIICGLLLPEVKGRSLADITAQQVGVPTQETQPRA